MKPDFSRIRSSIWKHLKRTRDVYLFPVVGVFVLYLGIRLVNHLTGRAVVDDPGAIIAMLYNAMGVLMAVAIVGSLQGFLIPDPVVKGEDGCEIHPPFGVHFINVLCTIVFYISTLWFIFR